MTIMIHFHQSHYRDFKTYYFSYVSRYLNHAFPDLVRYNRFVETVIDQLKNLSQIEHARHRSPINCMVNVVAGLAAYCLQTKKPSLNFSHKVAIAT